MNILITICARGGSKGVKDKNIREINGKPLIVHTIEQALSWKRATRIVCSTDSEKIAVIAKEHGAEVPFMRSPELASDDAGKIDVIRHAMQQSEKIFGETYDIIVDLDVTNPLRTTEDLNGCLQVFEKKKPDLLFTVVEARKNPYFNMVELNEEGFAQLSKQPTQKFLSRQSAPKVYDMNTSIYLYSKHFLNDETKRSVFSADKAAIYVMNERSAFDIDSERDFSYIEFLMKQQR